jgi:hypothetical protein
MSWDEFRTRLGQEVGKRAEYNLFRASLLRNPDVIPQESFKEGNFFFAPEELDGRIELLKQHLPSAIADAVEEADQITLHKFHLLGYRDLDYGAEIDWHLDAVHGKRAPIKPWYKIRFLDFDEAGDHKVTWELNRHQHFVTLAKACVFTGEDKYERELIKQFYSWRSANPYPMGINWGSSLEVAFRSLSWLWVRNLLAGKSNGPASFDHDLVRGLAQNGRYVERYLSTYFSPNTHLIGEAVALFFIGTLCPAIPEAQHWRKKGLTIVLAEAERQVRADGVYFEQSLYYHVYALDFFLHTRVLAFRNGLELPESFDAVLKKMLDVVHVLSRNSAPAAFGDDDGGRVFNARRNRVEHLSDPLALGAALFGSRARGLTEESVWLFGQEAVNETRERPQQTFTSVAFEDGGLYVIASSGSGDGQMLVDAGPHGIGHGGHGHADALSVRLSIDARQWLLDPGSFVYISPDDERNAFRGTAAHNTLRVDGLDQAVPESPFSWSSLPEVSAADWVPGRSFTFFSGVHDGYRRLPDPVLHRRSIFHLHGEYWVVRDVAEGTSEHDLKIFWHFMADVKLSACDDGLIASSGDERLVALSAGDQVWRCAVEDGFVSPAYGQKRAALVGVFGTRTQLPAEHATLLLPLHSEAGRGKFRRVDAKSSGRISAYSYELGPLKDYVIFGAPSANWSVGPLRSNAKFLFCRIEVNEIIALAFCAASFLEFEGHKVFATPAPVERIEWTRAEGLSVSNEQVRKFFDHEPLRARIAVR